MGVPEALIISAIIAAGTTAYQTSEQQKMQKEQQKEADKAALLNAPKPVSEQAKIDLLTSATSKKKVGVQDLFIQQGNAGSTGVSTANAITKSLGVG